MTNRPVWWRRLFGVVLSISVLLAGVCLMAGCVTVYLSEGSYSRQAVSDVFPLIALPVCLCLALAVAGFVWEWVSPVATQKAKPPKAYEEMRRRLLKKKDLTDSNPAIGAEQTRRKRLAAIRLALVCGGIGVFLCYALQGAHFHTTDINGSVIRAMWVALPCFGVPAGFAVYAAVLGERSLRREIDLLRSLPNAATPGDDTPVKTRATALRVVRLLLLAVAVGALLYGWLAGGTVAVLAKAVNICTECIGLG